MRTNLENVLANEIAAGDSLRLIDLAQRFHVRISTCFRWVVSGLPACHGERVCLEAIKRGKSWITSEAAVARFFGALPKSATTPSAQTPIGTASNPGSVGTEAPLGTEVESYVRPTR